MKVRTVVIESNGVPLVINESDFRHGSDVLWGEPEVVEAHTKAVTKAKAKVETKVEIKHKGGGRWTVKVNDQSVHEGTLSKAEAQALAAEY